MVKILKTITDLNNYCKKHGKSLVIRKQNGITMIKGFRGGESYDYPTYKKTIRKNSKKKRKKGAFYPVERMFKPI